MTSMTRLFESTRVADLPDIMVRANQYRSALEPEEYNLTPLAAAAIFSRNLVIEALLADPSVKVCLHRLCTMYDTITSIGGGGGGVYERLHGQRFAVVYADTIKAWMWPIFFTHYRSLSVHPMFRRPSMLQDMDLWIFLCCGDRDYDCELAVRTPCMHHHACVYTSPFLRTRTTRNALYGTSLLAAKVPCRRSFVFRVLQLHTPYSSCVPRTSRTLCTPLICTKYFMPMYSFACGISIFLAADVCSPAPCSFTVEAGGRPGITRPRVMFLMVIVGCVRCFLSPRPPCCRWMSGMRWGEPR